MKEVSALLIALLCWSMAAAQTGKQIAIIVVDSFNNVKMTNASIIITRASNSALMISGRTNTSGYCLLSIKDSGRYVLQVSYPGYSDYSQKIIVSDRQVQTPHYLVSLIPIAHLLEEVVVKNEIMKIRMNGDTMEYRADSFLTDRNASVEDLLKKLPGITVDAGGKISVYGKRINKILIGGEEYFGEDPALVSRSLRSNIVQKVQVFDKLSDQAAFSKINDGKAVKAINLELKADKKKGYFGKAEGGAGFGNFYNNQLLINRFNGDQKFALYFIQSNVGTTGLNWQDTRTYSDFSLTSQESGGFTTSQTSSLENWDGSYQKQGIPFVTSLGVHYSDKLNDRFSINDSYRFYLINLDVKTISDQQFNLNNAFYLRKQNTTINNNARSNREIVKTTVKLSKKSDLLVGLDLNTGNKNIYNTLASSLYLDTVHKLNTQGRTLQINGRENNFTGTILWRTRFSSGSTLTISGKILCNANEFNGYLVSKDSLFQNNLLSQDSLTDQYKTEVFHNLGYNTKTVFSLPINVHSNLSLSADYTQNSSENSVVSFNRNSAGQYALEDLSLTDKYTLTGQNATLGLGYNFSKGKILLNAMVDAGQSFLKQQIENKTAFVKSYLLLFPTATITYSFNRQHKLILDYTGTTQLPQIKQLQPSVSNIDPLNQMTGNPNLSVAFRNIFNIQYYQFITSRDISISAGGAFSFDNKGFSTNEVIDQYGKTTHSFINIPGNKRLTLFSYYTFKPFHKLLDISLSASANGTENAKIINNTTVLTRFIDYGVSFNPSFYRQDLINVECKTSFRWNNVFSNTLPVTNQRYTNLILQPAASINLVKYTILKMDYYYSDFPSSQLYEQSQRVSIFNISISQQLGKERSFTIQFSVKDIFNTSKGLSRRTYDNYVTQTSFNTIARYFMLSVVYNFSHTLKKK